MVFEYDTDIDNPAAELEPGDVEEELKDVEEYVEEYDGV